jgi:hypothetical protein
VRIEQPLATLSAVYLPPVESRISNLGHRSLSHSCNPSLAGQRHVLPLQKVGVVGSVSGCGGGGGGMAVAVCVVVVAAPSNSADMRFSFLFFGVSCLLQYAV